MLLCSVCVEGVAGVAVTVDPGGKGRIPFSVYRHQLVFIYFASSGPCFLYFATVAQRTLRGDFRGRGGKEARQRHVLRCVYGIRWSAGVNRCVILLL